MAKGTVTRRDLLRRAGVTVGVASVGLTGGVGAWQALREASPLTSGGGALQASAPGVALAQDLPVGGPPPTGAFFNPLQAETVAAIAERIMPGAPGKPGATDANVLNYIDLALAGAYADLREFYRSGLVGLDNYSQSTYGQPFRELNPDAQDAVLTALESGDASGFTWK